MIVIEENQDLLTINVYGELTLDDFREFELAVMDELKKFPQVNLLFDLSNMTGFTVDVAWEELQFNRQHVRELKRIAVVTHDQWLTWLSWLSGAFTGADAQTFPEADDARAWLATD
jgi:hypothetical protein